MDKKTKGSWLVHQTSKLQNVNNQSSFENTYFAGKAGILLSALSSDEQTTLPKAKVEVLARASNVNSRLELPELLTVLEKRGLIDTSDHGVEVLA